MPLLDLEPACGVCSIGEVEVERHVKTGMRDEYNEPTIAPETTTYGLLAPMGAQHDRTEIDEDDRHQSREFWRFWIVPPADVRVFDRLHYAGCCFQVRSVRPVMRPCCNRHKLHHLEVEACSVQG